MRISAITLAGAFLHGCQERQLRGEVGTDTSSETSTTTTQVPVGEATITTTAQITITANQEPVAETNSTTTTQVHVTNATTTTTAQEPVVGASSGNLSEILVSSPGVEHTEGLTIVSQQNTVALNHTPDATSGTSIETLPSPSGVAQEPTTVPLGQVVTTEQVADEEDGAADDEQSLSSSILELEEDNDDDESPQTPVVLQPVETSTTSTTMEPATLQANDVRRARRRGGASSSEPRRLSEQDRENARAIGATMSDLNFWSPFMNAMHERLPIILEDTQSWVSREEALEFWNLTNGPRLLGNARRQGCRRGFDVLNNICRSLILLASRIPVPQNFAAFYDEIGITQFIEDNHAVIVSYISQGNQLASGDFWHLFRPDYETLASLWNERFPNTLTNNTFISRVALNHRLTEYRYRNITTQRGEPLRADDLSQFTGVSIALGGDSRNYWLESYNQLRSVSAERIRRGVRTISISGRSVYSTDDGRPFSNIFRNTWYDIRNAIISSPQNGGAGPLFEWRRGTEYHQIVLNRVVEGRQDRLDQYRVMGRVFALSIIHGIPLGLNLPVAFYKRLLGYESSITLEDLRGLLANEEFIRIRYIMDSERTEEELAAEAAPLVGTESSENVSLANRDEQFAAMLENVSLNYSPEEFDAIADGLLEIIPRSVFGSVRPEHVAEMISGVNQVDVEDMVRNFHYNLQVQGHRLMTSYTRESDQIQWLTAVLNRLGQPMLRQFLRVYTGSHEIPAGGFAYHRISVSRISRLDDEGNVQLPTTQNRFRSITLPVYESEAELELMLRRSLMSQSA